MKDLKIVFALVAIVGFFATISSCGVSTTSDEVTLNGSDSLVAPDHGELPNGDYVEKYADGTMKIQGTVFNGKRTGTWVSFHPNGNKASESNYDAGQLLGKTVSYYKNGMIRYIGYYEQGQRAGKWQFFNEDGTEDRVEDFSEES